MCLIYNIQISKTQYTGKIYTFQGVEYNIQISNDQYTSFLGNIQYTDFGVTGPYKYRNFCINAAPSLFIHRLLQHILPKINDEDTIFIMYSDNNQEPIEVCSDVAILLDKSFSLIGTGDSTGDSKPTLGCRNKNTDDQNILRISKGPPPSGSGDIDEAKDYKMYFRNIKFQNVKIASSDINVDISDCIFESSKLNAFSILDGATVRIAHTLWDGDVHCKPPDGCSPTGHIYLGGKFTSVLLSDSQVYHTKVDITIAIETEIIVSRVLFTNKQGITPVWGMTAIALMNVQNSSLLIEDCQFRNIYHWNPISSVMNIFEAALLIRYTAQQKFETEQHNNNTVTVRHAP